jgi:hypothetical protein
LKKERKEFNELFPKSEKSAPTYDEILSKIQSSSFVFAVDRLQSKHTSYNNKKSLYLVL